MRSIVNRGIAGRQARQRRQLGGDLVFAAQAIEQRGHAAADLDVARLSRLRVARRLERAVQVAELVAHLAQRLPLGGPALERRRLAAASRARPACRAGARSP